VVILLVAGAITAVATGAFSSLFIKKSAVAAFYEGTENLFYETSSGTMDIRAGARFTVKWDLGSDLESSTLWGYSGGTGFVLKDGTIYYYESTGSGASADVKILDRYEGVIGDLNDEFKSSYGVSVDFNKIVKNGKFDRAYIEEINQKISAANPDTSSGYTPTDGMDTDKITEILNDFLSVEVNKKQVQDKFMSNVVTSKSGGTTTYSATFDPVSFIRALSSYAYERGKDAGYADAADTIVEACDGADSLRDYVNTISVRISITKKILTGLEVSLDTSSGGVSMSMEVTDINSTDLSKDEVLKNILDAPVSSSSSLFGDLGGLTGVL